MNPTYYATPAAPCSAPARSFPGPEAAPGTRPEGGGGPPGCLGRPAYPGGRPKRLAAFSPHGPEGHG